MLAGAEEGLKFRQEEAAKAQPAVPTPEPTETERPEAPSEPEPLPTVKYGGLKVPFECSTQGKELDSLSEGQFRNLKPWCDPGGDYFDWSNATQEQEEFRKGYLAIAEQMGYFKDTTKKKVKK